MDAETYINTLWYYRHVVSWSDTVFLFSINKTIDVGGGGGGDGGVIVAMVVVVAVVILA